LAAIVWFSMVTWLYTRTHSIWDCVLAHATTNLLLGLYIVNTGAWELW
jgi:membrane protease YdiL (CAAX protease family)